MGIVPEKHTVPLHTNAAPAVGVIHEDEFAPIGMGLFERGEFPGFGPEDF
jgi:hypothetical protein